MIIFTNGCFDILHVGHFNLLNYCRWLSDDGEDPFASDCKGHAVVVGLDSDEKIMKDKGSNRPYFTFEERKKQLLALRGTSGEPLVDHVVKFDTNEQLHDLIKQTGPDVIVKGQHWEGNVIGSDLAQIRYYKVLEELSTTKIAERVLKKHE